MTRINLVPPAELMDQHLFAEFREIKMVPKALARSLFAARLRDSREAYDLNLVLASLPKDFTLNAGHVKFFYNKGAFLHRRYYLLRDELGRRGIKFDRNAVLDPDMVFNGLPYAFYCDYVPTEEALTIVRARIAEKIALRPGWYRYYGEKQ